MEWRAVHAVQCAVCICSASVCAWGCATAVGACSNGGRICRGNNLVLVVVVPLLLLACVGVHACVLTRMPMLLLPGQSTCTHVLYVAYNVAYTQ